MELLQLDVSKRTWAGTNNFWEQSSFAGRWPLASQLSTTTVQSEVSNKTQAGNLTQVTSYLDLSVKTVTRRNG